jgi:hypothetical protein
MVKQNNHKPHTPGGNMKTSEFEISELDGGDGAGGG